MALNGLNYGTMLYIELMTWSSGGYVGVSDFSDHNELLMAINPSLTAVTRTLLAKLLLLYYGTASDVNAL